MKIKDFNNFINHNEHVNERYIIEDLDILKYHLKEFKKFLYHETNKIGNTGLIIQLSENFDLFKDVDELVKIGEFLQSILEMLK